MLSAPLRAVQTRVLAAFFRRHIDAESAVAHLIRMGVIAENIRLLPKILTRPDDIAIRLRTRLLEGTAIGAIGCGISGAALGAIGAGGAVVAPFANAVIAGPLVAALAVGGLFGAIGTVIGAIAGAFVRTCEARYLEDAVHDGGSLVAVRCLGEGWGAIIDVLVRSGGVRVRVA
jgi:hypothetical protein